jgi:hypothetical protein
MFSCDSAKSVEEVGYGLDARLNITNVFSGEIVTPSEIDSQTTLDVTCDGGDCYLLELAGLSFPCPMDVGIEIELQ